MTEKKILVCERTNQELTRIIVEDRLLAYEISCTVLDAQDGDFENLYSMYYDGIKGYREYSHAEIIAEWMCVSEEFFYMLDNSQFLCRLNSDDPLLKIKGVVL